MRDLSKDLTFIYTGTGATTFANLQETLENWIFGDGDGREVRIIVPLLSSTKTSLKVFFDWATKVGADLTIVRTAKAPMTRAVSALSPELFVDVSSDRENIDKCLILLENAHNLDHETAFVMQFNPDSKYKQGDPTLSDQEIIGEAKNFDWLLTLNASLGMQDYFEGYESEDDRQSREMLEDAFKAEQDRLNALASTGVATEKAPAPRKRAAKKAVAPKPEEVLVELEKAPESLSVGDSVEVAGMKFTKHSESPFEPSGMDEFARVELPIDKLVAKRVAEEEAGRKFRETHALAPVQGLLEYAGIDLTDKEVYLEDQIAKAAPKAVNSVTVRKTDLIELGKHVEAITTAFSGFIATYTRIMEES